MLSKFDLPVFERILFALDDGSFGSRDTLLQSSFSILNTENIVFVVGGGANYFQYHYNVFAGFYGCGLITSIPRLCK